MQLNPILERETPSLYENMSFIDSEFVKIKNDESFHIDMQYVFLKMNNAEPECFVRVEVYNLLKEAAKLLPKGIRFRIWDAWRPFELQKELYYVYKDKIIKDFDLYEKTKVEQDEIVNQYVALPNPSITLPPAHTTGGAVDITLEDANGTLLKMGSDFDEFSLRTKTTFYENTDEEEIKNNRRLLYEVMTSVGFTNLPSEWWHFDYGDRNWAYYNKKPAIYKGVFDREGMNSEEKE